MDRRTDSSQTSFFVKRYQQTILAFGSLFLGLAVVVLASAFIQQDNASQPDGVYQVCKWMVSPDGSETQTFKTAGLLAPELTAEISGTIDLAARFMKWPEEVQVTNFNRSIPVDKWAFADPAILQMFNIKALHGNLESALAKPGQLVITERSARAIFGTSNPVGFPLKGLGGKIYTVKAVIQDLPRHFPIHFDLLAAWSSTEAGSGMHHFPFMSNWTAQVSKTFVRLQDSKQMDKAEAAIQQLSQKLPNPSGHKALFLQPMSGFSGKTGTTAPPEPKKYGAHTTAPASGFFVVTRGIVNG